MTTSGYSWNGNITANVKPLKKLGIQIRADYQGPQVVPQGTMKALYGVDGGVRYDLTKTLNISMNSRDIFNTRKFITDINYNTPSFTSAQVSDRRFSTRTVIATIAYRFGSNGISQKRSKPKDQQQPQQQTDPDMPDNPLPGVQPGGGGEKQQPIKPVSG